ncbi:MAG: hypothetical protein HY316_00955 [Acidobacteria bacterium]|nr:hypothetical protein [Acidobacteriota bacterium]
MMSRKHTVASAVMLLLAGASMIQRSPAASITIPAGTTLTVRMADSIDSDKNYPGETFRATIDTAVTVNGTVVVPQGAEAIGRVTSVIQPGRFRGRPVVMMELTALNFGGRSVGILTSARQEMGGSRGKQTALFAGGGGVLGTVIGTIAGGGVGFLLGSSIGAAGGAVVQAVRGAEPVRIPAESLMLFTVQSPVAVELAY